MDETNIITGAMQPLKPVLYQLKFFGHLLIKNLYLQCNLKIILNGNRLV